MLGEFLTSWAIAGIGMTIGGVFVVVADRRAQQESPGLMPGRIRIGVLTGIGGTISQAIGGVFSKLGMRNGEGLEICDPAETTLIRLLVSAVVSIAIVRYRNELRAIGKKALEPATIRLLIPATALGTWLGIWMSQVAYNHTIVAVAQTLLATCPIFAIPIVWMVDKHKVTYYSVIGTLIAVLGIALVVGYS